jgi:hypothetical protein
MTALRLPSMKTAVRGLAFSLLVLASGAAQAAPKADIFYDCVAQVQAQYLLDQANCLIYVAAQRDLCNALAAQHYGAAMAGCAVSASEAADIRTQVSPGLKQNRDSAFLRRLRF